MVSSGRSRRKLKLRKRTTARAEMICGLTSRIGVSDFSCYHAIAARFVGHSEAVPDVPAVRPSEWLMRNRHYTSFPIRTARHRVGAPDCQAGPSRLRVTRLQYPLDARNDLGYSPCHLARFPSGNPKSYDALEFLRPVLLQRIRHFTQPFHRAERSGRRYDRARLKKPTHAMGHAGSGRHRVHAYASGQVGAGQRGGALSPFVPRRAVRMARIPDTPLWFSISVAIYIPSGRGGWFVLCPSTDSC